MKANGFTLAEMVAVIAILMVLSILSAPFVKSYIDDSYNGKAQIFLRQLYEARRNFEKDFPGTTVTGEFKFEADGKCELETIYGHNNIVSPEMLVNCNYVKIPTDLQGRYSFALGDAATCSSCKKSLASMLGEDNAGAYKDKCACADEFGEFRRENPSN